MSHPDLGGDAQDGLRRALGSPEEPAPPPARGPEPTAQHDAGMKAAAKRALRPVVARVSDRVAARLEDPVARRVLAETQVIVGDVDSRIEVLRGELQALVPALHVLQSATDVNALAAAGLNLAEELHRLDVNLELNKGELASIRARLEDFGQAVAPGAGLAAAPARFAELRERVNALDRRSRAASAAPSEAAPSDEPAPPPPPGDTSGFDYVGFEQRFRGDPAEIAAMLCDRYLDVLADRAPVLDVGCGRGELLAELSARGIAGEGVDLDPQMVAEARAAGVEATVGDAVAFLRDRPDGSFGAVTAIHVVEHLELDDLVELLELAARKLRPGGVLVTETPNPMSLIVLGNSYVLDPTHVRPLHPSLMTFLCERAGFRDVELRMYSPADGYRIDTVDDPYAPPWVETVNAAIDRLNDVLFGPQEYATVATTPPGDG